MRSPRSRRSRTGHPRTAGALAALALLVAAPAFGRHPERSLNGEAVSVRVLVDGRTAPLYSRSSDWDDRRYFQAHRGGRYAIELRNLTGRRIGVLMTVDGLNVITGERSSLDSHESMYVLEPWARTTIRGWRSSLRSVQQFVFVDERRSYAERTGQANGDMGWIRILTFEEERPHIVSRRRWDDRGPYPLPATPPQPSTPQKGRSDETQSDADVYDAPESEPHALERSYPGTGWGDRRDDRATRVEFSAVAWPSDRLVLRYEYASALRELGLLDGRSRLEDRDRGEYGFARPPR